MENSFSDKIKDIFFNHRGRFSRETFVITFAGLLLFIFISSPLLYKLCGLFLPWLLIVLLAMAYVVYMIYAMIVLCIKRLHDLNMSGAGSAKSDKYVTKIGTERIKRKPQSYGSPVC